MKYIFELFQKLSWAWCYQTITQSSVTAKQTCVNADVWLLFMHLVTRRPKFVYFLYFSSWVLWVQPTPSSVEITFGCCIKHLYWNTEPSHVNVLVNVHKQFLNLLKITIKVVLFKESYFCFFVKLHYTRVKVEFTKNKYVKFNDNIYKHELTYSCISNSYLQVRFTWLSPL